MKVRQHNSIEGSVYIVELRIEELSENDRKLMQQFGHPDVQVGGSITSLANSPTDDFTVPEELRKIDADFKPYRLGYDADDYANAEDRAKSHAAHIITNITSAMTTLRANGDTHTGETVTNI